MTKVEKALELTGQSKDRSIWSLVDELIEMGQYDQAAEQLRQAGQSGPAAGDAVTADLLAAAQHICQIASHCRQEIGWHRQAVEEARQREQLLGRQLQAVLNRVDSRPLSPDSQDGPDGPPRPTESDRQSQPTAPTLAVYCLGDFRVTLNDQLVTAWNGLKARSIFKYLLAHQGAPIAKDRLMDVFWPEAEPEAARRNLHQAIYSLRQTFKQACPDWQPVQFEHDRYFLDPNLDLWLDFAEFEAQAQAGQQLEAAGQAAEAAAANQIAVDLYRGDFMEEELFEDWSMLLRGHLRSTYLDTANRLSEHYVRQGDYPAAIALCQKILTYDDCLEETHRRLMRCYQAQNRRTLAIKQYQTCVRALKTELDVGPSAETHTLYRRIVEGSRELSRAEVEAVAT